VSLFFFWIVEGVCPFVHLLSASSDVLVDCGEERQKGGWAQKYPDIVLTSSAFAGIDQHPPTKPWNWHPMAKLDA
jgi:hypothetical protein